MIPDDHTAQLTHPPRRAKSLSVRYISLIVAIVVLTGAVLGGSVTLIALGNAARERQQSLEYASTVVAASLLPVIADQDPQRVEAQLNGILELSGANDIVCIEVADSTGVVIAETDETCTCDLVAPQDGLLDVLTEAQVVRVPMDIDGLHVATVSVQFLPVGLEQALFQPISTTLLVLGLAMVVSALWGGWMVLRTVVEPIAGLRDVATDITNGSRTVEFGVDRGDEIGELARTLRDMAGQLESQEQQLRDSYASLESAFNDKADLALRLEQTMTMKSDFVATASHEIRSPLTVIRLYAEMLEGQEFGDIEPRLDEAVAAIADAAGRLSTIVAGLLDVTLLERGLMSLEYSHIDLADIVEQAVIDGRLMLPESGDIIELADELPSAPLRGDAVRLRQVMDNLLSNARKYSNGPAHVKVTLDVDDDEVILRVSDEGIGVSENDASVMFELFGRVDSTDNAQVSGLGLGLPISYRIVKAHGGDITFEPNPAGRGTVFIVRLPLEDTEGTNPQSVHVV